MTAMKIVWAILVVSGLVWLYFINKRKKKEATPFYGYSPKGDSTPFSAMDLKLGRFHKRRNINS